jgi:hypothetical protein
MGADALMMTRGFSASYAHQRVDDDGARRCSTDSARPKQAGGGYSGWYAVPQARNTRVATAGRRSSRKTQIVWSAISQTFDLRSVHGAPGLAEAVIAEPKARGLTPPSMSAAR